VHILFILYLSPEQSKDKKDEREIATEPFFVDTACSYFVRLTAAEQSKDGRDTGSNVPAAAAAGRGSVSVVIGRLS